MNFYVQFFLLFVQMMKFSSSIVPRENIYIYIYIYILSKCSMSINDPRWETMYYSNLGILSLIQRQFKSCMLYWCRNQTGGLAKYRFRRKLTKTRKVVDSVWGWPDPIWGWPDPIWGWPDPIWGWPDPIEGWLDWIWGWPDPILGWPDPIWGWPEQTLENIGYVSDLT